jgi:biopolymer transport protein ExbD
MRLKPKSEQTSTAIRVDLTPMIDCVMNLVIFFMIINAIVTILGMTLKKPREVPQSPAVVEKTVEVYIGEDKITAIPDGSGHKILEHGVIKLNGEEVTFEEFRSRLKEELDRVRVKSLVIKAEKKAHHWKVIKIMDLAKDVEREISFSLQPAEEGI